MATNRNMYDTSSGNLKNISLGDQNYGNNTNPYSTIDPSLREDILKNSISAFDYPQDSGDNIRPLGQYGIGESRYDEGLTELDVPYLQNIRAGRQGPIAQFGSFLNQAVIGELVGGTIEGIGYLGAMRDFNKIMDGVDTEFGNGMSRAGKALREWTKEATPVYEYESREGEFRPWDWSWWMTNGASIASSLALMAPAVGIGGVVARVARLAGAGANTVKGLAGISSAVASSYMENMMEASGTYDQIKEDLLSKGYDESSASKIAAKGAKNTYLADWVTLIQDIPQYLLLNRAIGKAFGKTAEKEVIERETAKAIGGATAKQTGEEVAEATAAATKKYYTAAWDMLGEAAEESYQYESNLLGLYTAEKQVNPNIDYGFLPYANENTNMGEMMTSAFFGAIGAGVMQGGRKIVDKVRGVPSAQVAEAKNMAEQYATIAKDILNAEKNGDTHRADVGYLRKASVLATRAARMKSTKLANMLLESVTSGDFAQSVDALKGMISEEELASLNAENNPERVAKLKETFQDAIDTYTSTRENMMDPKHSLGKGVKKAFDKFKAHNKGWSLENYSDALAGVITQTHTTKKAIDSKIPELEQEAKTLETTYENTINQAFSDLSPNGRNKFFYELKRDALTKQLEDAEKIYTPEALESLPEPAKKDIESQKEEVKKEIAKLEEGIKTLDESRTPEEKKKDAKSKLNKNDFSSYQSNQRQLAAFKRDSYVYGQALKRYYDGNLISDKDFDKYAKQYNLRNEEFGETLFEPGDKVRIGENGPQAIIDKVEQGEGGSPVYTTREYAINENKEYEFSKESTQYDEDDLWIEEPVKDTVVNGPVDVISSTITSTDNLDANAEVRGLFHSDKKNDPHTTLHDMISISHINKEQPNSVEIRDKALDALTSTPNTETKNIDQILKEGTVEYEIDLKNAWFDSHNSLKKDIEELRDPNIKMDKRTRTRKVNKVISKLISEIGTDESNFAYSADKLPIRETIITSEGTYSGDGEKNNLYVHDSDFWNIDAPFSIIMKDGEEGRQAWIKEQRLSTRELRIGLIESLLLHDKVIGKGLNRLGGHINRSATQGAIHERLGVNLNEMELWVGLEDGIYADSGKKAPWPSRPGTVLFETNKTLTGESIFINASISTLSQEHARIMLDAFKLKSTLGWSAILTTEGVTNLTAGEALDLLVISGEKASAGMVDKSQRLFIDSLGGLNYGEDGLIENIHKMTKVEEKLFLAWATTVKKYRVPFSISNNESFRLNGTYKNRTGFKLGSFEVKPGDTRTWAQVLLSTVVETKSVGGTKTKARSVSKYAVSTNVQRVADPITGNYVESIIHTPSLQIIEPFPTSGKSNNETEKIKNVKKNSVKKEPVDKTGKPTIDNAFVETKTTVEDSTVATIIDKKPENPEDVRKPEILGEERFRDWGAMPKSSLSERETARKEGQLDSEIKWVKSVLGNINVSLSDKFIEVLSNSGSKKAYGLFTSSCIQLYTGKAPIGVPYHEVWHRVSLGYFSKEEEQNVYNEARSKYNMPNATDSEIEEILADKFRLWKNYKENADTTVKSDSIINSIKRLYNFIVYFITGSNRLSTYDIETIFKLIDSGRFKWNYIKNSRKNELEDIQTPYAVTSIGEGMVDIPFINTRIEFTNFIKGLSVLLLETNDVYDLSNIKDIKFSKLFNYINNTLIPFFDKKIKYLEYCIDHNELEEGETIDSVRASVDIYRRGLELYSSMSQHKYRKIYLRHLKAVLSSEYSVNYKSRVNEELFEDEDEDHLSPSEMITRYGKESFELNVMDNISSNVKYIVATLPVSENINPLTQMQDYVNFKDTWQKLFQFLHDKKTVKDMMETLKRLAETDYSLAILYHRLSISKSPNMRNQFKTAIHKHRHDYVNITWDDSTGKPSFEVRRADVNRAQAVEVIDWMEDFIQSDFINHGTEEHPRQTINVEKLSGIYEDYSLFENDVLKKFIRGVNTPEELQVYKDKLLFFINAVKINIDMPILDQYILKRSQMKSTPTKVYTDKNILYELITSEFSAQENKGGYFDKLRKLSVDALEAENNKVEFDIDAKIRELYTPSKKQKKGIEKYKNLFIIRELSRLKYEVYPETMSDFVIGPEGHMFFTYSPPSYATDRTDQLQDLDYVNNKRTATYNKNSYLLDQISKMNPAELVKIRIKTMSSFQELDANDPGTAYTKLNHREDYLLRMVALQNGLIPFPIIADRSTYYFLDGFTMPDEMVVINESGNIQLSEQILDIFLKYAEDERQRIKEAIDVRDRYIAAKKSNPDLASEILRKEMVINYHYRKDGDNVIIQKGNAYTYTDFPSFNTPKFNFDKDAKRLITKQLNLAIDAGLKHSKKLGLYKETIDINNNNVLENKLIDNKTWLKYSKKYNTSRNTLTAIIAANEIGMVMANIEINKLFIGDPAFFKRNAKGSVNEDRIKRLGVLTSSGDPISQVTPDRDITNTHFNIASLYDQNINYSDSEWEKYNPSNYYNILRSYVTINYINVLLNDLYKTDRIKFEELSGLVDQSKYYVEKDGKQVLNEPYLRNIEKSVLLKEFNIDVQKLLSGFRGIDHTDGQAYVSPEMYRSMLVQLGEWPEWKEKAFDIIMKETPWNDLTNEDRTIVSKLYMHPLKPVFFDTVRNGNIEIPTYLKMSVMPLFPALVKNTQLKELADRMSAKGSYEGYKTIEMIPYDSAIKVGGRHSTKLYSDMNKGIINNGKVTDPSISTLHSMEVYQLPFASLRKQIVTDPHDIEETKLGTQFIKIALGDLLDGNEYYLPGYKTPISGQKIRELIFNSLATISDKGLAELKEDLGYDENTKQIDLDNLARILKRDAENSNMPELTIDALRTEEDGSKLYLELDAFTNRKQIFSRLIGMVTKATIDIEMPGNQFIQLSNNGLHKDTSDRLKWYGFDENGVPTAAECEISISMFKHLIPNYGKISPEEASDYILKYHPEVLAYRIPTQGQSSAIYLKVAKLLPSTVGDVIVLPEPIVTLSGSDFDIDKVFAIRHSYSTNKDGSLEKIEFYDREVDGVSPKELAFEHQYTSIMNDAKKQIAEIKKLIYNPEYGQEIDFKIEAIKNLITDLKETLPKDLFSEIKIILDELEASALINDDLIEYYSVPENAKVFKELFDVVDNWNHDNAKKEFLTKHEKSNPYQYNSDAAVKNRLLDCYIAVYRCKTNILQTQVPLGGVLSILKAAANEITDEAYPGDFYTYSAVSQNKLKYEYTGGKEGIGPFALNNSHHILSQIAKLKHYETSFGILNEDKNGHIDFSRRFGKDHRSILNWLSAMIDAHVDLAKDNYIMRLNVNEATYNVVSVLLRGGLGVDTFKIVAQPIVKDYAMAAGNVGNSEIMDEYWSKNGALRKIRDNWKSLLSATGKVEYDSLYSTENKKDIYNNLMKDPLSKELYNVKILEMPESPERDKAIINQLLFLDLFEHFNRIGDDLNNFIQLCQIDTKKFARTIPELINYQKRLKDFNTSNRFINAKKLLPIQTKDIKNGESLLGPYYKNSISFLLEMLPKLTIYASPMFIDICNSILNVSKNGRATNKKLINIVSDELFGSIIGDFFYQNKVGEDKENSFNLNTTDVKTIANDIMKILTEIKYSDTPLAIKYRENPIMRLFLKKATTTAVKMPFSSFIAVVRKAFSDKLGTDDYMYGILDLLTSKADPNNPTDVAITNKVHKFAIYLFVYSYMNSGFRNKLNSFYNVIPPSMIKELQIKGKSISLNEFIKKVKDDFANGTTDIIASEYVDRVFRNNWYNRDLVKVLNKKLVPTDSKYNLIDVKKKDGTWRKIDPTVQYLTKALILRAGEKVDAALSLGVNKDKQPLYIKYILYYQPLELEDRTIQRMPHLMEYIGFATETIESETGEKTDIVRPVYKTVPRSSYEKTGVVVKEAGLNNSIIEQNNEEGMFIKDGDEEEYFNSKTIKRKLGDDITFTVVEDTIPVTKRDEKIEAYEREHATMFMSGKTVVIENEEESPEGYTRTEVAEEVEETGSTIYNELGDKTVSENVVIEPWVRLKDEKESIIRDGNDPNRLLVVSTRIRNSNTHFGNPFSHDPAGKTQGLIKTETIREAVENYIDWIINGTGNFGFEGDKRVSTEEFEHLESLESRRLWIREQLQSGELKDKPILYYKELGEPSHATALDYLINKYKWSNEETQSEYPTIDEEDLAQRISNLTDADYDLMVGRYNLKDIEEAKDIFLNMAKDRQLNILNCLNIK